MTNIEQGKRLKTFRKYNFMTQKTLSEKLKVSRTKLSRYENSKEPVPSDVWSLFVALEKQFKFSIFMYFIKAPIKWLVGRVQTCFYKVRHLVRNIVSSLIRNIKKIKNIKK